MKNLIYLMSLIIAVSMSAGIAFADNTKIFDQDKNSVGNIEFITTNYGIFGLDVAKSKGAVYWPRNSDNQYIFASGFWFGAQKRVNDKLTKLVEISYNPNNGRSWFVPGRLDDAEQIVSDDGGITYNFSLAYKYQNYINTLFDSEGNNIEDAQSPAWPLWKEWSDQEFMDWMYIGDLNNRNTTTYPLGPMYISDEDAFSTYHDGNLNFYDGGKDYRAAMGYPLGLQVEQIIYTWEQGPHSNDVVLFYKIENTSEDTLYNCYFSQVHDVDIALKSNSQAGASNDRMRYYIEDPDLELAIAWTNGDMGEQGKGFGYLGFSYIMTPSVDDEGYLIPGFDHPLDEQLGLNTFINGSIEQDFIQDINRYDAISSGMLDPDHGPGDKRGYLSTGGFHMKPGDVALIGFLISFDQPDGAGGVADKGNNNSMDGEVEADGTMENATKIVERVEKFFDFTYNDGFLTSVLEDLGFAKSPFEIYPNPANDAINISYPEIANAEKITVCDLNGTILIEHQLSLAGSTTLSTSGLAQGTYLVNIHKAGKKSTKLLKVVR